MTADLTDAEILQRFEAWKADFKAEMDKRMEERMAAFQPCPIIKDIEDITKDMRELYSRIRTLERQYHKVSVGGLMYRIRGR